jgi:hypothetical protein
MSLFAHNACGMRGFAPLLHHCHLPMFAFDIRAATRCPHAKLFSIHVRALTR